MIVGARPLAKTEELFCRDDDVTALQNLLLVGRGVLLYGRSGVGKTSLLDARNGLRNRMVSDEENPNRPHKREEKFCIGQYIDPPTSKPDEKKFRYFERLARSLDGFLDKGKESHQLVVIDQVERCWQLKTKYPDLVKEFCKLIQTRFDNNPKTTFLLVIQEEYLAPLLSERERLPDQLNFKHRLCPFDESTAQTLAGKMCEAKPEIEKDLLKLLQQFSDTQQEGYDPFRIQILARMLLELHEQNSKGGSPLERVREEVEKWGPAASYTNFSLERVCAPLQSIGAEQVKSWLAATFLDEKTGARQSVRLNEPDARGAERWWSRMAKVPRKLFRWVWQPTVTSKSLPAMHLGEWDKLKAGLEEWGILRKSSSSEHSDRFELSHDRLASALRTEVRIVEGRRPQEVWLRRGVTLLLMLLLLLLPTLFTMVYFLRMKQVGEAVFKAGPPTFRSWRRTLPFTGLELQLAEGPEYRLKVLTDAPTSCVPSDVVLDNLVEEGRQCEAQRDKLKAEMTRKGEQIEALAQKLKQEQEKQRKQGNLLAGSQRQNRQKQHQIDDQTKSMVGLKKAYEANSSLMEVLKLSMGAALRYLHEVQGKHVDLCELISKRSPRDSLRKQVQERSLCP